MKKSLVLAILVVALGYAVGLFARIATSPLSNTISIPAVIGGFFAASLLVIAFSDYTRKPRFRAGGARKATSAVRTPVQSPDVDPASAWTYTTFSA